jgi:hypothetical protein
MYKRNNSNYHALIPALDDVTNSNGSLEGLSAVNAAIELLSSILIVTKHHTNISFST